MQDLTAKELELISDALTAEGLICKKARAYSKILTDVELAGCMTKIADEEAEDETYKKRRNFERKRFASRYA